MSDRDDDYDERDARDDMPEEERPLGVGDLSPFSTPDTDEDDDLEYAFDDSEWGSQAEEVYESLLGRIGEAAPQPRLEATRRVVELLGDPHRAYPVIHVTGTNGKTSTSRIIESILRAYGLRTGLMTSPHLERVNERIVIDGRPVSNRDLVANWGDVEPFIQLVDGELVAAGDEPLTYFEALTVLAFATFAEAPVDVAVIEVGMGGEWDSTNVADGQVAVFSPIALDHTQRLGSTIEEIARTKSGIIKPVASVVSAAQTPAALAELRRAAELTESTLTLEDEGFALESTTIAVGGQLISVRGRAGIYEGLFLPLFGEYQAHNAALAIAAVESFLGDGTQPLVGDVLAEGLGAVTSPGRLQPIGTEPTVLVDAAHNPHGAAALATAIGQYFDFDEVAIVLGVLQDKDARGIVAALAPIAARIHVTQSSSDRAVPYEELVDLALELSHEDATYQFEDPLDAIEAARAWAAEGEKRGVVVTGSITLVGEAIRLGREEGWLK